MQLALDMMSKEKLKGILLLWILIIAFELVWLFAVTWGTTAIASSIIALIVVTMIFRTFGIYMVSKNVDYHLQSVHRGYNMKHKKIDSHTSFQLEELGE